MRYINVGYLLTYLVWLLYRDSSLRCWYLYSPRIERRISFTSSFTMESTSTRYMRTEHNSRFPRLIDWCGWLAAGCQFTDGEAVSDGHCVLLKIGVSRQRTMWLWRNPDNVTHRQLLSIDQIWRRSTALTWSRWGCRRLADNVWLLAHDNNNNWKPEDISFCPDTVQNTVIWTRLFARKTDREVKTHHECKKSKKPAGN